ncbi:nitrilase-related carbon-nitrogen hydrolase [Actinokineospora sp. NBRC 105648]|uniref:nitrilase-related carbon-nitrogen hydrolase n=1 Tax=Actinokineospora sp. NBRC 105648 TaxID=3032206 RepID=UPI00249FF903|nr:nitrilase-related carbon-nitrogen hydrolase [Actinokineospora sp. NBRC 105648]GLZ39393.1 hypothetical protein Acsp05_30170 [Actinokineospora sp. NBRC 105648]
MRTPPEVRPRSTERSFVWLVAGGLLSLFAVHGKWDIAVAAWIVPVFLLRYSRGAGVLRGFLAIVGVQLLAGAFWLYQADSLLNSVALGGIGALSVALGLPFLVDRLTGHLHPVFRTLVFPSARVAVEFGIAALSPFGAIYGSLGTTQYDFDTLIQISSVFGAYAVSFLVAWVGPVANLVWERRSGAKVAVVLVLSALVGTVGFGVVRMVTTRTDVQTVRVAGVSPTAGEVKAWTKSLEDLPELRDFTTAPAQRMRDAFSSVNARMVARTEREAQAGAEVITWSESAGQAMARDKQALIDSVAVVARRYGVYVNVAMSVYTDEAPHLLNQAILLTPQGHVAWTYDKGHPVPGLEPETPTDSPVPVIGTPHGVLAALICFDADFPDLTRAVGGRGAGLVLVPANNWEGIARLHAEKARFRAIEGGFSLVHQASKGIAEVVDPLGRVVASADFFVADRQVVRAEVTTRNLNTVYARIGDVFAWVCAVVAVLALCSVGRRQQVKKSRSALLTESGSSR